MDRKTRRNSPRGAFLTLEGPEGSGKSTQVRHLAAVLRNAGYHVTATREPGGTKVAETIRKTLLSATSQEPITAQTEALLVLAARCQHVAQLILPALAGGSIVLCDRFADSTFAYQGFGRGLSLSWLRTANRAATGGLVPDLTLVLDLPVTTGLTRRGHARGNPNRLDRESVAFHQRVRRGFLRLAAGAPRRMKVINAARPIEIVRAEIEAVVLGWVRNRERGAGAR